MPSLNQTLQALQPYILHQRLPLPPGRDFSQLYILGEEPVDQKFSLYIGTPDSFVRAADALSADKVGFTFVLAGSSPALAAYQQRDDLNLVTTSLSLSSLCNLLYKCFAENDRWARHMYTHLYIKPDLPALLDCGARRLGGFSCLLDPGFKLLGCSGRLVPPIPVLQELVEKTYLPYEDFHLLEWLRTETSSDNWLVPEGCDGSWLMCARQIKYKAQLSAYHLIALPAALCNPATRELAGLFQGWTEQFVTRYNADKYETTGALSSLVADLIEGRLTESEQMVGRLKLLPIHMQKFYHVVVVEPSADADPATLGGLMQALERIFPLALVANYDGHIVILAWKPYHYTPLTYDREALSALLRYYDAYACIGNFTKWLSSLGPLYHQTKRVIKYARAFCEDPEERIFRFEDYSVYQIVDICLEQFRQMPNDGGDPVYLCHPGIITLVTYDRKHGTNLFETLYAYLKNERNLSQTSRELFLHRNTLQKRIEKIESIIDEQLDSSAIRQRLLLSCAIVEYMQKVLHWDDIYMRRRGAPPTSALF